MQEQLSWMHLEILQIKHTELNKSDKPQDLALPRDKPI